MDFCLRVLCTRLQVFGNGVSSDFDAAPVCVRGMGARWFCRLYQSSGSDSTVAEWQCKKEEDKSREDRLADVRFMKEKFPTVPVAIMMLTSDHRYGKGRVAGSFEAVGFAIRVPGSSWSEVFESEQWN